MKILSISSDRKVFEQGSAVRARLLEYGRLVDELHVIVFAKKKAGFRDESFPPNIFLYSTNSLSRLFYIPGAVMRALKLKRRGVLVDVVTTQDPFEAGLAGYIISRIFSVRLHVQIHTDMMSPYFLRESLLNRARVCIAKFLLPRANAIRVVSERIKKSIEHIARPHTPIDVLPIFVEVVHPTNTGISKKKHPQFNKTFLVASRLSPEKNIAMVIAAMRAVAKKYPATGLVIVGDGPERDPLRQLVKKYNLDVNVVFEGWRDNLAQYYKEADALILSSYYEGYGMVAVEALSHGCPVIMTDVGCAGDIVIDRQNGLVVPVGDGEALAHAIELIVSGKAKFDVKSPDLPTKEEYLARYKRSWENVLAQREVFC